MANILLTELSLNPQENLFFLITLILTFKSQLTFIGNIYQVNSKGNGISQNNNLKK